MGWTVVNVYRDQGVSGAKSRKDRPAFDALWEDAARRRFDLIMAWSVDRLGRSLQDLVAFLADVHGYSVDLFLHQQGVDTTTPGGKALFQMMGVFAEFERAIIRERVKSGLERAKVQGKRLGRRPIDANREAAIRADLLAAKAGIMKLAAAHGVGVGTVQRIKAALAR
jgi:DNA invertase Pin-like site-specific DNA recombinase